MHLHTAAVSTILQYGCRPVCAALETKEEERERERERERGGGGDRERERGRRGGRESVIKNIYNKQTHDSVTCGNTIVLASDNEVNLVWNFAVQLHNLIMVSDFHWLSTMTINDKLSTTHVYKLQPLVTLRNVASGGGGGGGGREWGRGREGGTKACLRLTWT